MIRNLAIVSVLLLGVSSTEAQEVCKRDVEPQGGFSLCVPDGWIVSQKEGEKYKILTAAPAEVSTANINMQDEMSGMPLKEYSSSAVDYILKNYVQLGLTAVRVLAQDSFTSKSGLTGIRFAFHVEAKGESIRSIQYYFNGNPGQILVLTCTVREADQVTLDPVCDRAAKTLQLEEKTKPPKEE